MKQVEEQNGNTRLLNDMIVSEWLHQHPDFFIRNASQVEQMVVPHPVRGSVSLVEWQMSRYRQQIEQLREEITLLLQQGTANHRLFEALIVLQKQLATASSLAETLHRLSKWAKRIGLKGATVRLFSERWRIGPPSDFAHLAITSTQFAPIQARYFREELHYLGIVNQPELYTLLLDETAIGSIAMSLLGERGDLGVLIFSSSDSKHFQPDSGTLVLRHLANSIPDFLAKWIERT